MTDTRKWKPITGYEGLYEISNVAEVRSLYRYKKQLKGNTDGYGYKYVVLYKNKTGTVHKIHRLLMQEFVGYSVLQVNHKNGIKDDNRLENLEYCTASQNIKHSFDVLGKKNNFQTNHPQKGKDCKNNHHSKKIKQYTILGDFIKEYPSIMEAERQTKILNSNISRVCKGLRGTAGGFKWRYNLI